jgi:hypothetical protein
MAKEQIVTASLIAQNTFSDGIELFGEFNLSLTGTWSATVTHQRSFDRSDVATDAGATWEDVTGMDAQTENISTTGTEPERNVFHRTGVKTGNFSSGTVAVRLSQGGQKSI